MRKDERFGPPIYPTNAARMKRSRLFIRVASIVLLLALFVGLGFPVWPHNFGGVSVCALCGKARTVHRRLLPFTDLSLFTTNREQDTPVSLAAESHGFVSPHTHQWTFCSGGHNSWFGWSCALGVGMNMYTTTMDTTNAKVIDNIARFTDDETAKHWMGVMFDSNAYRNVAIEFSIEDFPQGGFEDQESFSAWWNAHASKVEAELQNQ